MNAHGIYLPANRSVEKVGMQYLSVSETPDEAFARIERERKYRELLRKNKPIGQTDPDHPFGDMTSDEYEIIVAVGQTIGGYEQDRTAPARYAANVARLTAGRKSLDGQVARLNGNAPDAALVAEFSQFNNLVRATNGIVARHRRAFDEEERQPLPLYPGFGVAKQKWWQ